MGGFGFLLIIVAFAFLYFVLVRPQKRRQLAQQQMLAAVEVGDEIVTAGGLYGEVREVHEDEVLVRIAPELDVRVAGDRRDRRTRGRGRARARTRARSGAGGTDHRHVGRLPFPDP